MIEPSAETATDRVARILADAIRANPHCVLGLATGRTVEPVYARLASIHRDEGLSLRGVTTFNLDEYVGVSRDDERSFHRFTLRHLAEPTDLPVASVHVPDGAARDVFMEAELY